MDLYSIDVSSNGDTVWVTGDDGSCIGRFSKRAGIDVHRTVTEQMAGAPQCLHCTHEAADETVWKLFRDLISRHFGIDVPADTIVFNRREGAL
ncbi:hypothetical protein [Burkholderia vietnamiensis]|uniref:hypothetical protein n=1 Tax=Burkholderia vietnamiensis TaxID=60552 RepID=UPI0009B95302|nr:hypothetical protein [Burkholderia vietnamiensis]HDR9179264.1 hypothetical protein [Burkholderia vietnamiensis]